MDQGVSPSPASARAGAGIRWEPHGRMLTACLVALNVFLVLLVYVYFWRFFSRTRGGGGEDGGDVEAASSAASSPKAGDRREVEFAITALPVFVVRRTSSGAGGGADTSPECAICIAEFADGEEGRLLPRCGHRFHARCVDAWFRFHTTCPLCRATVLADAAPAAPSADPTAPSQPSRRTDTDRPSTSTDAGDADSPV
ncbi:hypothetical protein SETIT_3G272900v2 [Setaria italica]|uniref:RING-type E3 ubiquitin transferase n=2 Tax=Setaria TaxID=4554 RepID=K3Z9T2_SETIT|nr:RING-H2 finger protein ATL39 [Setaria italica]XP_034587887.1 RING-H2 finger protein ATL39-like [Setaria viridis]RCV18094.1 hypothetical protein SETIT_3G272900v2 [Setaria italica]TKW27785.1 hypothetical protein SEVIR_3G280500v2 [Setaria viridis]